MKREDVNVKFVTLIAVSGVLLGLGIFALVYYLSTLEAAEQVADTMPQSSPSASATTERPLVTITPSPTETEAVMATSTATETKPTRKMATATTEPPPDSQVHIVQAGENLFRISTLYGVSIADIMVANGLVDSGLLYEGQALVIPKAALRSRATAQIAPAPVAGTDTPTPTATSSPVPTASPTASPFPPSTVNGVPITSIVVLSPEVVENARQIFLNGQQLGLNPRAFSKVGDSTIENPHFLARFDDGTYNLGEYAYLQPVIDYFSGSFGRQGMAVRRGFHSWTVTDPMWADKENCLPNETPVACEIRIHRPAILLIRLGSNDAGVPGSFDVNLRQVVEYAISQGVIPVIGTKADRFEGPDNVNNNILRQIAADYRLPLWDFDAVAGTIPNRGLYENDVHLTIFYPHDYTDPRAFQTGHGVHNLTALILLDTLYRQVILPVVG